MRQKCCVVLCLFFSIFLSGCSQTPTVSLINTVDAVYGAVLDPYNEYWLTRAEATLTAERLGVDRSLFTEARSYLSEKETVATIFAGFTAADGKTEALETALKKTAAKTAARFEGFLPDQYAVAGDAEIKVYGAYVFLIMTEENDVVFEALDNYLNGRPMYSDASSSSAQNAVVESPPEAEPQP